jgi:hypothetical protein
MLNILKRGKTMDNKQRPSGAAPLGSRAFYEKPNPYWLQQAEMRKRARAQGHKRARLDKE